MPHVSLRCEERSKIQTDGAKAAWCGGHTNSSTPETNLNNQFCAILFRQISITILEDASGFVKGFEHNT